MPQRKTTIPEKVRKLTDRRAFPVAITVLQIVAAAFFAVDAIEDYLVEAKHGFSLATAIEFFIAVALLGGIFLSSRYVVHLTRELRWNEHSLARAKGALMDHMAVRFQEWGLTPGEPSGDDGMPEGKHIDATVSTGTDSIVRHADAGTGRSPGLNPWDAPSLEISDDPVGDLLVKIDPLRV